MMPSGKLWIIFHFFKGREKEMNDINENQGLKRKLKSSEIVCYGVYGIGIIKLGRFNTPNLGLSSTGLVAI